MSGPSKAMLSAVNRVANRALSRSTAEGESPFARIAHDGESVTVVSEKTYPVGSAMLPRVLILNVRSPRTMDAVAAFEAPHSYVSTYDLSPTQGNRSAAWCGSLRGEKDAEKVMRFCFEKIEEMTRDE